MTTFQKVVEESFNVNNLCKIDSEKLVAGLKILKKLHQLHIPVGIDNHLEKITSIKHTKSKVYIKTHSSELVIRVIDLKHHLNLFVIQ